MIRLIFSAFLLTITPVHASDLSEVSMHSRESIDQAIDSYLVGFKNAKKLLADKKIQDQKEAQKEIKEEKPLPQPDPVITRFQEQLNLLTSVQKEADLQGEALAHETTAMRNGDNFLRALTRRMTSLSGELVDSNSATYNYFIQKLLLRYYQEPESRDAVAELIKLVSSDIQAMERKTPELAQDDRVLKKAFEGWIITSMILGLKHVLTERGGLVNASKYYYDRFKQGWGELSTKVRSGEKTVPDYFSTADGKLTRTLIDDETALAGTKTKKREFCEKFFKIGQGQKFLKSKERGKDTCIMVLLAAQSSFGAVLFGAGEAALQWEPKKYDPAGYLEAFQAMIAFQLSIDAEEIRKQAKQFHKEVSEADRKTKPEPYNERAKVLRKEIARIAMENAHLASIDHDPLASDASKKQLTAMAHGKSLAIDELFKELDEYRSRSSLSKSAFGIPKSQRLASLIDDSESLTDLMKTFYEHLLRERSLRKMDPQGPNPISLKPIQDDLENAALSVKKAEELIEGFKSK